MKWNPSSFVNNITNNRYSNFGNSNGDKSSQGIVSYSVGFVHPALSFNAYGLNQSNTANINGNLRISNSDTFDLERIKTKLLRDNRSVRESLMSVNPTEYNMFVENLNVYPDDTGEETFNTVENIFTPSVNVLMNMNNYRFQYNSEITNCLGYYKEDGTNSPLKAAAAKITVAPSLFNPLYMIQVVGMTTNVPLLNNQQSVKGVSFDDVSDCSIKELVRCSYTPNSILGLARYRYSDFMYCKDLGKIANNHLITLRRFARPVSDNIFELSNPQYSTNDYSFSQSGDIGRLVAWFDTEDNKLEDILKFTYRSTWKELKAKIEEIESKEDDQARGPLGMLINSASPSYNALVASGAAGAHHIFTKLGATPTSGDAKEMMRMYDNNKVYTPKDTIQDTHVYEGKLEFTHEFTLTFSYKLRAYDNINPKSAFIDLIGNVLAVTYRRGKFWGGDRRMIGPSQNTAAWKKANAFIDNAWDKLGGAMAGIMNGTFNLGAILGSLSGLAESFMGAVKNAVADPKGTVKAIADKVAQILQTTKLDQAALGTLKNHLGRPALYAMDSLLKGDDVGLWHVTIGNPKNPIAAMGNLILTDASIQQSGPLGLDDFPTELKVTVTLKHARSRDAVEIGRMYTKGTNGIYFPLQDKSINNWFTSGGGEAIMGKNEKGEDIVVGEEKYSKSIDEVLEERRGQNPQSSDITDAMRTKELASLNAKIENGAISIEKDISSAININNGYKAQIDQHNQVIDYELLLALDELA